MIRCHNEGSRHDVYVKDASRFDTPLFHFIDISSFAAIDIDVSPPVRIAVTPFDAAAAPSAEA